MVDLVYNSVDWFMQIFGNLCKTLFDFMSYEISFGTNQHIPVALVLGGTLLLALLIYKVIQWLAPII